jgi:hypothetical protein
MMNFFQGTRRQKLTRVCLFTTCVLIIASILFCLDDDLDEHFIWGPSDDFVVVHAKINTWFKYLVTMFVMIPLIEICMLLMKLYGKSVIDTELVLKVSDKPINDFTPFELFKFAMWVGMDIDFVRFYLFYLFISRFDVIIMMFLTKHLLLGFAYWACIKTKTFTCQFDPDFSPSLQSSIDVSYEDP